MARGAIRVDWRGAGGGRGTARRIRESITSNCVMSGVANRVTCCVSNPFGTDAAQPTWSAQDRPPGAPRRDGGVPAAGRGHQAGPSVTAGTRAFVPGRLPPPGAAIARRERLVGDLPSAELY
jgi:hypothetical protein